MFNERKGVSRPADVREDRRALLERTRRERDERQNAFAHLSAAVAIQRAWRRFVARRQRRLATRAAFDADIRRAENGTVLLNMAAVRLFVKVPPITSLYLAATAPVFVSRRISVFLQFPGWHSFDAPSCFQLRP